MLLSFIHCVVSFIEMVCLAVVRFLPKIELHIRLVACHSVLIVLLVELCHCHLQRCFVALNHILYDMTLRMMHDWNFRRTKTC